MKGALIGMLVACFLASGLRAQSEAGISAEIVPSQVRPGDLFELRVAMDRADYARFQLRVPGHERLHRVAVEAVPVRLEGGRYRQEERWLLQASSSGALALEGLSVSLETAEQTETVKLPSLHLEVLPYAEEDGEAVPMAFPAQEAGAVGREGKPWWWLIPLVVVLGAVVWWSRKAKPKRAVARERERPSLADVIKGLESGAVDSSALQSLLEEQSADWSQALREAVGEVLYGGEANVRKLAELLRKEGAK